MGEEKLYRISIPNDDKGFFTRQCPICNKTFKLEVNEFGNWDEEYLTCPYCFISTSCSNFLSNDQMNYVTSILKKEILKPLKEIIRPNDMDLNIPFEKESKIIVECLHCKRKIGFFENLANYVCPYCNFNESGNLITPEVIELESSEDTYCNHLSIEKQVRHGELEQKYYCNATERNRAFLGYSEEEMNKMCEGCLIPKLESDERCIHREYTLSIYLGTKKMVDGDLWINCNHISGGLGTKDMEEANEICEKCDDYISSKKVRYRKITEDESKKQLIQRGTKYIYEFETQFRNFIEEKLKEKYKENWWKSGVPNDVRDNCEERKRNNEKLYDTDESILDFADFSDYKKIISRRDNWREIFSTTISDKTIIEGKLTEMEPIRNAIQHNRIVTQRDINKLGIYVDELLDMIE